jgi:hypothetical protein
MAATSDQRDVVLHQGALGDAVLLWPLLRGLERVTLVTQASKGRLATRCLPHVEALDIDGRAFSTLHAPGASLDGAAAVLRQARRIISFVSDGHDAWSANVRGLAAQATLAFVRPRPPRDWPRHVCDFHMDQLQRQGVEVTPRDPQPRSNPGGPVVLHPGSGGAGKVWPLPRWAELADRLRLAGHDVRCVVGEVELERMDDAWRQRLHARPLATLDDLCDELLAAKLLIGNDSGPAHLAAQLGIATLALFGPSDARHWSPRGPRACALAPPTPRDMAWLGVEDVWAAIA